MAEGRLRKWLLSIAAFLRGQNGGLGDAMALWRDNCAREFDGLEECLICYSGAPCLPLPAPAPSARWCACMCLPAPCCICYSGALACARLPLPHAHACMCGFGRLRTCSSLASLHGCKGHVTGSSWAVGPQPPVNRIG